MDGVWRRYQPDFVARLRDGTNLIVEVKGVTDQKAETTEHWTRQHWIPAIAGTDALPDGLRRWSYLVLRDRQTIAHDLNNAVRTAIGSN